MVHSDAMRRICSDAPVAWPHDGNVAQRNIGGDMMPIYKQFDLGMLPQHAQFVTGGYSTEAAVLEMQQDFRRAGGPGGLRVREDLSEFWVEYRQYHRRTMPNGRSELVKKNDHLLSALMKARMMKRFARPVALGNSTRYRAPPSRRASSFDLWTGDPIWEDAVNERETSAMSRLMVLARNCPSRNERLSSALAAGERILVFRALADIWIGAGDHPRNWWYSQLNDAMEDAYAAVAESF